jgi:hypothetical protein
MPGSNRLSDRFFDLHGWPIESLAMLSETIGPAIILALMIPRSSSAQNTIFGRQKNLLLLKPCFSRWRQSEPR